jgi:hypothetical protein
LCRLTVSRTVTACSSEDWARLRDRLEREVQDRIRALATVLDDLMADGKLCELPPVRRGKGA